MLIVICGIDGSGKTTVLDYLHRELSIPGLHFPVYDSPTGKFIKQHLRGDSRLDALSFQALMLVNRLEVLPQLRAAAGSTTTHLALSRYWQSGYVYGQMDGLDPEYLRKIHACLPHADVSVLLSLDGAAASERVIVRDGLAIERYEKLPKLHQAAELYEGLWRDVGAHTTGLYKWVNAQAPESEVCATVGRIARECLARLMANTAHTGW